MREMNRVIVVLDLDRTLNQLIPDGVRSIKELAPPELKIEAGVRLWLWIAEHVSRVEYPVNAEALELVKQLRREASSMIVNTGRPQAAREATERWLGRYFEIDRVYMREDNDFRPTPDVKRHNLREVEFNNEPIVAMDDKVESLLMYRGLGATPLRAPDCWKMLRRGLQEGDLHEAIRYSAWAPAA